MIKIMKLQKAVIVILLAIIALAAYMILNEKENTWSRYLLEVSGFLFMLGGFLFLYPILFSRKDKEGCVELDPDVPVGSDENQPLQP